MTNSAPSTVTTTPDILLEAIDSFIDLYADEERDYDVPVFRQGGMLEELDRSVQGVRAAVSLTQRYRNNRSAEHSLTLRRTTGQEDRQVQVPGTASARRRRGEQPRRLRAVPQGHPQGKAMSAEP